MQIYAFLLCAQGLQGPEHPTNGTTGRAQPKGCKSQQPSGVGEGREESKAERIVGGERYGNVEHTMKKARVVGMQAQAEKIAIETIQTKLMLLRENADVYKAMHGEELYNKMVVDLLNKMMGATNSGMGETPVSAVSAISSQRSDIDGDDANNDDE
jgi:hypothetical protein